MILCDIGNTTFHFKISNSSLKLGVEENLDKLPFFVQKIYFISVNTKATQKLLDYYPNAINIKNMIEFQTSYIGMGIDRQVICSAIENGILIDSGSAITVDIVKHYKHKGGFILPGMDAYKEMYPNISKKLRFKFKTDINLDKIPLNTNDAINYAILASIILPILNVQKKYNLPLYFTGGNSKQILKYFNKVELEYDSDLIFHSMKKIIKENKKIKGK